MSREGDQTTTHQSRVLIGDLCWLGVDSGTIANAESARRASCLAA